jgi:N-acetylmuramoyl-L-alanine amidase
MAQPSASAPFRRLDNIERIREFFRQGRKSGGLIKKAIMPVMARTAAFIPVFFLASAFQAFAAGPLVNIDAVAIDVGHDADDSATSKIIVAERTQCRLLANALKETIEKENGRAVKIIFTSATGMAATQRERAFAANSGGAKIYISLHGYPEKQPFAGVYVATPPDEGANSWKEAGAKYSVKSSLLASKIKSSLEYYTARKYFIGTASLTAFYGVAMPAVAIEAAPISSAPLSQDGATKLAVAIYSGILDYSRNQ